VIRPTSGRVGRVGVEMRALRGGLGPSRRFRRARQRGRRASRPVTRPSTSRCGGVRGGEVAAMQRDDGAPHLLAPCRVSPVGLEPAPPANRRSRSGRQPFGRSDLALLGRECDTVSNYVARNGGNGFAGAGRQLLQLRGNRVREHDLQLPTQPPTMKCGRSKSRAPRASRTISARERAISGATSLTTGPLLDVGDVR